MSWDTLNIESGGGKFLKIESGKSADIHVLTKSENMVIQFTHWTGEKYTNCSGKDCQECNQGKKPNQRFTINALDRSDNQVKIFQFGPNVGIGIKEIAKVLKEDQMTIHDVDLRISRISENPVRYQVVQKKKAGEVPPNILLHDLKKAVNKDDECPF